MGVKELKTKEAIDNMAYAGKMAECCRYGHGHINDTFYVRTEDGGEEHAYILQRMNRDVFKDPVSLMRNIKGVTSFLRREIEKEGGDPLRETLNLVPTKDGADYYVDSDGEFWRSYLFIAGATCYDAVEKPEDFYQSAKAFGRFQRQLSSYPAKELAETIPNLPLSLAVKAEEGKLFGTVTATDLAEALAAKGITVDRKQISVDAIKTVGEFEATARLHKEVKATIKFTVTAAE